jgi:ribA/ribD-fused uncharacterized protein
MEYDYDLKWLTDKIEKGEKFNYLFFWEHRKSENGELTSACLSQWWEESPIVFEYVTFKTAEHWMMGQKALLFDDYETYSKILSAKTPAEAKALGRQVANFDESVWQEKRFEIVARGNSHKFGQHKDLEEFLLSTKDSVLVEASPVDKIWGIGLSADNEDACNPKLWKGLNLLGFALMRVRDITISYNKRMIR